MKKTKTVAEAKPSVINQTVIEAAKAEEKQTSIVLFMNDLEALRVIEAWRLCKPKWTDRPLRANESVKEALAEVWQGSEVHYAEICESTGFSYNAVVHIFNRLKTARLIYPDGTAHKGAGAVLNNEVAKYLKSLLNA